MLDSSARYEMPAQVVADYLVALGAASPKAPAEPSANISWSSARSDLGSRSDAASRMSMCRKPERLPRRQGRPIRRISSLRTSAGRESEEFERRFRGVRRDDRRLLEDAPHDGRPFGRRALVRGQPIEARGSSAMNGGGTGDRAEVPRGAPAVALATSAPSSMSMPTNSSTYRGFPSAAFAIRARTAAGRASPGTRASISLRADPSVSGSSRMVVAFSRPPPHVGRSSRNSRTCRAHEQDRRIASELSDRLDQVEQRRLRPVNVVDEDHDRQSRRRAAPASGGMPRRAPPGRPILRDR